MSCLFNSIGYLLNTEPQLLRERVCDYLESNPKCFDDGTRVKDVLKWQSGHSPDTYIRNMRSIRTWGSSHEIRAICDMVGIPIVVHNIRDNPPTIIEFSPLTPKRRKQKALHITWSGGHYEPLPNLQ